MQKRFIVIIAVLACGMFDPGMASAGSLGTYCWQLVDANGDIVCLNVNDSASQAGIFGAAGTQSTSSYKYPVVGGVSFDERSGSYQMFWTTYVTHLSTAGDVTFGAIISPSGSGQWFCGGTGCPKLFGNTSNLGPLVFQGLVSASSSLGATPK
jgi:hypothetical protein